MVALLDQDWPASPFSRGSVTFLGVGHKQPAPPLLAAVAGPSVDRLAALVQRDYVKRWDLRIRLETARASAGLEHEMPGGAVVVTEPPLGVGYDYVWCSDVMRFLCSLPDNYVDCVVTSPPYFGLRDYGVDGQIGLEPTPAEFVAMMVAVFREVWRVLKPSGTVWLNLGDSYWNSTFIRSSSSGAFLNKGDDGYGEFYAVNGGGVAGGKRRSTKHETLKEKDLMMIPARVAIALQDDGWYLRSEIVWHKPSVMPESVTDRPTKSHEMVYLLTKCPDYFYDQEAIREPVQASTIERYKSGWNGDNQRGYPGTNHNNFDRWMGSPEAIASVAACRNKRDVWTVPSEPTPFAHFATFPRKLIEPMILAGCPEQVCLTCGAPYEAVIEKKFVPQQDVSLERVAYRGKMADENHWKGFPRGSSVVHRGPNTPTCKCGAASKPGVVLDPFMGSGTTALVARANGRYFIGCDLNPEYVKLARERLRLPFEPHHMTHDSEVADLPLFAAP